MLEDGIQFNLPKNRSSVIKVIGVGGGGSNAVNHMTRVGVNGVDFIVCNTDAQALYHSPVANKVQLGASLTEGLGAGADPDIGRDAARESLEQITAILETGTKMCFVTAGMGGGTGTGAAPVIAKAAKDMGILTVGIITAPFSFEGNIRSSQAEKGIDEMRDAVDSLIVINNDKLRQVYGDLGFRNAFAKADEVLAGAAKGIAEVITNHYTQNIDLRDAKTVLENSGSALFGTGSAEGANRASEAIAAALDSPLLNDNHIKGAKNVLLLLTSGEGEHEVTIDEIGEITDHIQREAGGSANVIMGIGGTEEIGSRITCTIVATGFPTGTRVLPTDKPEVVVHTLSDSDKMDAPVAAATSPQVEAPQGMDAPLGGAAAPAAQSDEPQGMDAPLSTMDASNERVVMDLGEPDEEEPFRPEAEIVEAPVAEISPAPEVDSMIEETTEFEATQVEAEVNIPATPSFGEVQAAAIILDEGLSAIEAVEEAVAKDTPIAEAGAEETVAMEAPVAEVKTEEVVAEEHSDFADIQDFEEESMVGFPQPPEVVEDVFESSLEENEAEMVLEEEPTVHVLEWDMEDELDEVGVEAEDAHEHVSMEAEAEDEVLLQSPVAMSMEPELLEDTIEAPAMEEEAPAAPLEAPSWDLFSGPMDAEEEEIELTLIEEEVELTTEEPLEVAGSVADPVADPAFDAPAPAPIEQPQGMIQEDTHASMPEALDGPIDLDSNTATVEEEGTTFTLEDIEGDGFTLEVQDMDPAEELATTNEVEETSYDAFEMSLGEMGLGSKADQETIEHSFTVPSAEFEQEAFVSEVKIEEAEDPIMSFEIKEREVPTPAPEEPQTHVGTNEMDMPLSQMPSRNLGEMPSKVKDRISRLQSFQYQFKANQQNLEEAERIPAYMRQGVEVDLNHKSAEQPSNVGVDAEGNLRTNNSFLHDNVD